jgi:hypothetical protein
MYSFWSSILLSEGSYEGNPMEKHIALSKIVPMTEIEFKIKFVYGSFSNSYISSIFFILFKKHLLKKPMVYELGNIIIFWR